MELLEGREDGDGSQAGGAAALPPPAASPEAPPQGSDPRVRTYEELDGADGRAVFFRPHRHTAADLAPLRGTVAVLDEAGERVGPLVDVSQNGVAFEWPVGAPVEAGQKLSIALRFDAYEAFRGEGRVGSVRAQDGATVVGLSFTGFLLDVEDVLQLRTVQAWKAAGGTPRLGKQPWSLPGDTRFKSLVAELRLFFEDARERVTALERELPWHVLQGRDRAALSMLVSQLREEFVDDAIRLTQEIDAAVRELPGGHANPAAKAYSQRQVDEFVMLSPCCHRARHKPFGYPGDYEVMNFIYEGDFEGANLFARAIQLVFYWAYSAIAVRARKDLVKRELKALLEERASSWKPVRILSIAAGPAQEVFELFRELPSLPVPVEVVLFEQDKNALAHAWRRLDPLARAKFPSAVRLTFLHDSIKRLLRDPTLFAPFGGFDLVFSCGLFDYLMPRTAIGLARHLFGTTAPGGRLLIANMTDHPARWLLEHELDWPLLYRTRDELLELGRRAAPGAPIRIVEEASGVNPFFELVRV